MTASLNFEQTARISEAVARARRQAHGEHRAKAREAMARARVAVRMDAATHRAQVREALERARARIAAIDIDGIRASAIQSAMASAQAHASVSALTAEHRAEIQAALEEARRDMATHFTIDMREVDEELKREIGEIEAER